MRILTAALVVLSVAAGAAQTTDIHGTWTVELYDGKAFLQVRTTAPPEWNRGDGDGDWRGAWNMGQSLPVDELSGLPGNDNSLTAAAVRFNLRREAGTLTFDGAFREGRGAGLFTFVPRAQFVDEMKRLGYTDDLPLWRRFQIAVHDVGPKYINALKSEGFASLPLDLIMRSKNHGVTLDYIKAMKAEGFKAVTLEEFIRTKDHGVTQQYVQDMRKAGFSGVPIEDLVRARDHGVSVEYVQDMRAIVKDVTLQQIVRMRDHGVTPGFVGHARARGFTTTDPDELVRLKDRGLGQR